MLFTWNTHNLCIIFKWWHIRSTTGLIVSLLGVVALTALYEAIRAGSRRYEQSVSKAVAEAPSMFPSILPAQFSLVYNWAEAEIRELELLLRGPLSCGQEASRLRLRSARMLLRRCYMLCRTFMRLCLCGFSFFGKDRRGGANGCRLLFMTYNGWVMLAVAVGAFVGYLVFGTNTSSTKDGACH